MNVKNWKVFTSKFVGIGPSSYKKRIYRAAVSQRLRNTVIDWQVAGCREGFLAQTEGEQSDVCFMRVIPVITFGHRSEASSWQLDVSAKTMYSSGSSDNEEFLGSRSLLQELPVREYPVHPVSVNTFAASYLNTQGLNNSCLKLPASTLVDLTFQSHALRSFSLNQLRNLSL